MTHTVSITLDDTVPTPDQVLRAQSIPKTAHNDETLLDLAEQGIAVYRDLALPAGTYAAINLPEFETVYAGEGANESVTPLLPIVRASEQIALYSVTVGLAVCDRIAQLFDDNNFALASMLDSAASVGVELAADVVQREFEHQLNLGEGKAQTGVMPFSPGYCGWHVSGQRALFDFLHPEEIGITLNSSFLMHPLKSISGVLVVGAIDIFDFDDDFPFCDTCMNRTCRQRIASLTG